MLTLKINIDNLVGNVEFLRKRTSALFCAVVKANGYGHGFGIIDFIEPYVHCFAVANGDEAMEARRHTKKDIYVLSPSADIDDKRVIYSASTPNDLRHKRVCVKINSGMNRLGVLPQDADDFISLCNSQNVSIDSIYTHFSDVDYAPTQFERFASVDCKGIMRHAAASNFLFLDKGYHLDMVRCGLAMYGYGYSGLKPVLSAYTEIYNIVDVKKGDRIGYSRVADRNMKVAVLGVGYADSIRRREQHFAINGRICRSVGNVCMDMCLADVSGLNCKIGDTAVVLGGEIDGEYVAKINETIVYDILTSFGSRCRRIYE